MRTSNISRCRSGFRLPPWRNDGDGDAISGPEVSARDDLVVFGSLIVSEVAGLLDESPGIVEAEWMRASA
jgi:hypothetical protein